MPAKRIPLLFASPATGPTSGTAPARWRAAYGRAALHGRAIRAQHHYTQPRAARDNCAHAVASGDASSRREAATSGASCFFMGSVTAPHLKTEGAGVRVRRHLRRCRRLAELCTGFRQENAHSRFDDFYFLERPSILWAKAQ